MSSIIYVVPWAICDTENVYIKKVSLEGADVLDKGTPVDDWCIRDVISSPDRRTKDVYAIVDVYNGYDFDNADKKKPVEIVKLTNSITNLKSLGYELADETERQFIREKVLMIDKAGKKKSGKKQAV